MSARFAPYPAYRTLVPGTNALPTHWSFLPLKRQLSFGNGRDHKETQVYHGGYPVYGSGGEFARSAGFLHDGESVLFGRKGTIDRPLYVNERFWTVDTMYFTRVAKEASAKYIYYCALGIPYSLYSTNTALPSMTQDVLGNHKVPFPPHEEQTQIAKFLDYETARIDALIDKQQQLIELLKEKRQAVISHAVTKGLDPKAPMRDSGVEWLGQVPAHWNATRLKFLVSHVVDCHHSTPQYDPEAPWPALRTADVAPGRLDIANARRVHTAEYLDRISRLKPEKDDIIYSREGERWGIAALVPEGVELCLAQRVMLFRAGSTMEPEFLMWGLNSESVYNQLAVNVVGATSPHVNIGEIKEAWLAVPSLKEQKEIVERLSETLVKLDALDRQAGLLIESLQERRTALISAAVTGKIDVRNWKAPEAQQEVA